MSQRNDLTFYDASATNWWQPSAKIYALNYLNPPRFAYFDRVIPNWQNQRVLDVGCGGGFTSEFLATRGAIVSGVDQSHDCILAARTHAERQSLAIDYQQGYAEALPYPDHSFDVVVCVDVLEHVADPLRSLAEIHRVLKPGGVFCFDTINRTFRSRLILIWLLENLLREIPQGIHDWQKFIKPEELAHTLQTLGFDEFEVKGFNIFGRSIADNIAAYRHYRKTGNFKIHTNDDTSVMYIGKARKV